MTIFNRDEKGMRIGMRRFLFIFVLALLLSFCMFTSLPVEVSDKPDLLVHNIDTGMDFATIQETIDAPETEDGHTIFVEEGTYHENVVLRKSNLTLIGENRHTTVIDGNGNTVVSLKGDYTKIMKFTVKNGRQGILMHPWTHGHIISNNIISNNDHGVQGHYDCNNVTICDNVIISNRFVGIIMLFSHSVIRNNMISNNGKGELQEPGSGIQIWKGVMNSKIVHCVNNTIFGNTIKNHQIGVWAVQYSEENLFFHNNFINNTKQFYILGITWNNSIVENYWSDYEEKYPDAREINGSGMWDTPYVIDENNQDNYPLINPLEFLEEEIPLWMQWWFWAIVAAGILMLAGAVYLVKRRRPTIPTTPTTLEGTVQNMTKTTP